MDTTTAQTTTSPPRARSTLMLLSNTNVDPEGRAVLPSDVVTKERALAALARRQDGVVTRAQLGELGFAPQEVRTRLASGAVSAIPYGASNGMTIDLEIVTDGEERSMRFPFHIHAPSAANDPEGTTAPGGTPPLHPGSADGR